MTTTAKTPYYKTRYYNAWTHHINELATLALAANIPYNEYIAIKEKLWQWRDKAMENDFNDDTTNQEV